MQQRHALILHQTPPDLHDQIRNIDLSGADILAGAALDAEPLDVFGLFQFIEPGGQNRADAAGIDLAEDMSAHQTENRDRR